MKEIKRGDIFWTELSPTVGSEQKGCRPTLIIQNDIGNKYSPTVIVAIITKQYKNDLPTHVHLDKEEYNLEYDSVIMLEQIRTIDKWRLQSKISSIGTTKMGEVDEKIKVSLGFKDDPELEVIYLMNKNTGDVISMKKDDYLKIINEN